MWMGGVDPTQRAFGVRGVATPNAETAFSAMALTW
jgi:hypothetical protein